MIFSPQSKVWIYQSNRRFTDQETAEIQNILNDFVAQWTAHGHQLKAKAEVFHHYFIVLTVDQEVANATGCSIDSSVAFIQNLEQKYAVDLLDKMNVTFKVGDHVAFKPLIEFKKMAKEKAVSENTIVFNNLLNTLGEWQDFWEVPASESWHNRFF